MWPKKAWNPGPTILDGYEQARDLIEEMRSLGMDITAEGKKLYEAGEKAFIKDYEDTLASLGKVVDEARQGAVATPEIKPSQAMVVYKNYADMVAAAEKGASRDIKFVVTFTDNGAEKKAQVNGSNVGEAWTDGLEIDEKRGRETNVRFTRTN